MSVQPPSYIESTLEYTKSHDEGLNNIVDDLKKMASFISDNEEGLIKSGVDVKRIHDIILSIIKCKKIYIERNMTTDTQNYIKKNAKQIVDDITELENFILECELDENIIYRIILNFLKMKLLPIVYYILVQEDLHNVHTAMTLGVILDGFKKYYSKDIYQYYLQRVILDKYNFEDIQTNLNKYENKKVQLANKYGIGYQMRKFFIGISDSDNYPGYTQELDEIMYGKNTYIGKHVKSMSNANKLLRWDPVNAYDRKSLIGTISLMRDICDWKLLTNRECMTIFGEK